MGELNFNPIIGFLSPNGKFARCSSWGHSELAKAICRRIGYDFQNSIDAERYLLDCGYICFRSRDACASHFLSKSSEDGKFVVNLLTDRQLAFIEEHNRKCDWNNAEQAEHVLSILEYHKSIKETLEEEGENCDLILNDTGELNMDNVILKYVPASKRDAIHDCYRDSDGYWIILKEGFNADRMDNNCRTIHEDTIKDLRYQIAGIRKV